MNDMKSTCSRFIFGSMFSRTKTRAATLRMIQVKTEAMDE